MSKKKDYIPTRMSLFNDFQVNLITIVTALMGGWGIPAPAFAVLTALQTLYTPAYAKVSNKNTRSKADIVAYRQVLKDYKKAIRQFVKEWLAYNSLVTNADRTAMGLTVRNPNSPRPVITDVPDVLLYSDKGEVIRIEFRIAADSSLPSLHPDADAIEVHYIIADATDAPFTNTTVITRKQAKVRLANLPSGSAGRYFIVIARWINESDPEKSGPLTRIYWIMISQ